MHQDSSVTGCYPILDRQRKPVRSVACTYPTLTRNSGGHQLNAGLVHDFSILGRISLGRSAEHEKANTWTTAVEAVGTPFPFLPGFIGDLDSGTMGQVVMH